MNRPGWGLEEFNDSTAREGKVSEERVSILLSELGGTMRKGFLAGRLGMWEREESVQPVGRL